MNSESFTVEGVGEIEVRRSSRTKRLILSITPEGKARITIPPRLPLIAAKHYAGKHQDWLVNHTKKLKTGPILPKTLIGRSHSIHFIRGPKLSSRVLKDRINVFVPAGLEVLSLEVQHEAGRASKRALKRQAELELPSRLYNMAQKHDYRFKEVRVKALKTRWGSCSSAGIINLSIWLMQLPDNLIDYVLAHELTHLNHPHHQADFWAELEKMIPDYKQRRKLLKQYRPALLLQP